MGVSRVSQRNESIRLFLFENVDELRCPHCGITGTLVYIEKKVKGKKAMQLRCMNPECHDKHFIPFMDVKYCRKNRWHKLL